MEQMCDETYGCGEQPAGWTVEVQDWSHPDRDDDGVVCVRVCMDCAATGRWHDG